MVKTAYFGDLYFNPKISFDLLLFHFEFQPQNGYIAYASLEKIEAIHAVIFHIL